MTNKKVMYMGPTLRGVARSGSVFENGLPANLSKLAEKKPIIKNLIVPLAEQWKQRKQSTRKERPKPWHTTRSKPFPEVRLKIS